MISHRYRCIYVKQPKCAGTSVRDWFIAHGGGRHSSAPPGTGVRCRSASRVSRT